MAVAAVADSQPLRYCKMTTAELAVPTELERLDIVLAMVASEAVHMAAARRAPVVPIEDIHTILAVVVVVAADS